MSKAAKILVFAGSARTDSLNKRLAAAAARRLDAAGARVTRIDLADYRMPLYDGDLESSDGVPEAARRLTAQMLEHDGLLIACPEYNSSITPLLKNTIDWCSRPDGNTPGLAGFRGKVAALVSASPGKLGGLRGLVHVRAILQNIGVMVVPQQLALARAHEAFDEAGDLADEGQAKILDAVAGQLASTTARVRGE